MSNFKKVARRKYVINEPRKRAEPQIWKPYKAKKRGQIMYKECESEWVRIVNGGKK